MGERVRAKRLLREVPVSDNIKQQLDLLEIKLNPTLTKTIKSASEETVLNAIEALISAMASSNIEKPGACMYLLKVRQTPHPYIATSVDTNIWQQQTAATDSP